MLPTAGWSIRLWFPWLWTFLSWLVVVLVDTVDLNPPHTVWVVVEPEAYFLRHH
jgi:hypothetical protein